MTHLHRVHPDNGWAHACPELFIRSFAPLGFHRLDEESTRLPTSLREVLRAGKDARPTR